MIKIGRITPISLCLAALFCLVMVTPVSALTNPQSGSTGLVGTIPSPPPSTGATISSPTNGQSFTSQPTTVSGLCPSGLLIEIFINNIFSGATECNNGSYTIQVSLFNGTNVITAVDYDALNQAGPTSNSVTVTYTNSATSVGPGITVTTNYAKLGADPGKVLSWPITISGGSAPYAISVDWGDGQPPELLSEAFPGTFNITHTYSEAGVYTVAIKATDTQGDVAYIQLVGVANGKISQPSGSASNSSPSTSKKGGLNVTDSTIIIIASIVVLVAVVTFWLGRKHELKVIRDKLDRGEHPF